MQSTGVTGFPRLAEDQCRPFKVLMTEFGSGSPTIAHKWEKGGELSHLDAAGLIVSYVPKGKGVNTGRG